MSKVNILESSPKYFPNVSPPSLFALNHLSMGAARRASPLLIFLSIASPFHSVRGFSLTHSAYESHVYTVPPHTSPPHSSAYLLLTQRNLSCLLLPYPSPSPFRIPSASSNPCVPLFNPFPPLRFIVCACACVCLCVGLLCKCECL